GAGEAKPNGNFTSACGQQVYRANLFPKKYHGNHFACDPQQSMVHRSILERDGAGLRARRPEEHADNEFLSSSDGWFRPNNLRVGPDGALYIVDMYRE
ncbi:MAG: dehydrogenase, partial [Akkermansiaceae bacterium]|nr:dehydrogenase [Akkermansiaceae bacterium]